ncbi:MAG: hypothetical protein HY877_01290 [Deltaproteobacteria bacterium]|nr:hypothetical protein [Deltaproteobacteria bacterium]
MRPISVVISSLRPERLEKVIDSTEMHSDLVEVVVASPIPPRPRNFVKHVPVPPPGGSNELSWSQKNNLAVQQASGEYIVFNNDDIHFRSGWAPALLRHMKESQHKKRPYLTAFHIATKGRIGNRYTVFGFLYPNHGCIQKNDLLRVGGTLFDERLWLGYNDVDLGLRVWFAGGEIDLCSDIILDADRDKPHPVTNPYRTRYYDRDAATFIKIWFPRYFWKFVWHYRQIRSFFSSDDGVLPPCRQNSGAMRELVYPFFMVKFLKSIGLKNWSYTRLQTNRLARIVNRRWYQSQYQVPYNY